ncbi:Mor transcription activator family protein [uncultured Desulfovibrio sp.]|uniref:Mor transcription activator family protein n=1 Tax=uncultured Desulfovibrio sp. TaxID=167968 RepID=UPI0003A52FAF|nr:Mor transcription activator family protein [uncultured Desulfovibrio sp.]
MGIYSSRAKELLALIAAIADEELTLGTDNLGQRIADRVADECGGQQVYFPFDRERRDCRIYEAWREGLGIPQIASRFKISVPHVYTVLNKEKALRRVRQNTPPGVVMGK